MTIKLHNPKANIPAVYIPCWLIQVPLNLISHGAKLLYGRLAMWSNEKGIVFRSAKQLAEEIGVGCRTVEKYIHELKELRLIGTYLNQKGGSNNFEFYDHPWMYEPINEQLSHKTPPNDHSDPSEQISGGPSEQMCGTPPNKSADTNNKEIINKTINNNNKEIFTLRDMTDDNPHDIPQPMIEDWLTNRKSAKAPVTRTAWRGLNSQLTKIAGIGIAPIEAFETMVMSGWRSLQLKYFVNQSSQNRTQQPKKAKPDHLNFTNALKELGYE